MAKRFTETSKWQDSWFQPLRPEFKLAWLYLCDACDSAGFVDLNQGLASFLTGVEIDWEAFLKECGSRIQKLNSGHLWLTGFVEFQQRSRTLNTANNAHLSIIRSLEDHGINPTEFGFTIVEKTRGKLAPKEPQARGPGNSNSKGKRGESEGRPAEVPEQAWSDWIAARRAKRLGAVTRSVLRATQREAAKAGIPLARAIEICAERSWGNFKSDWDWDSGERKSSSLPRL